MLCRFAATALIVFAATTASAAPKSDEAEKSGDPQEKMICKRFLETGSLVKGYRTCKTKREWERERDAIRMQNGNGGGTCSNSPNGC